MKKLVKFIPVIAALLAISVIVSLCIFSEPWSRETIYYDKNKNETSRKYETRLQTTKDRIIAGLAFGPIVGIFAAIGGWKLQEFIEGKMK